MPQFVVTFEDAGFTDTAALEGCTLDEAEIAEFNAKHETSELFPDDVLGVFGAYIVSDDNQGTSDIKMFVSVKLKLAAKNEHAAWDFRPPTALLELITETLVAKAGKGSLDMEDSWEVLETETLEDALASVAN